MSALLRDAVICEPVRTPVGGYGGVFRDVPATELAAAVVRAVLHRTGLPPAAVDDVLLGQCYPNGEAPAIGRVAALDAGLPVEVPGLQIDRRCGSGLQAIITAAMQVQTGASDLVLAGGVESMSQAEFYTTGVRFGVRGAGTTLHDRLARGRVTSGGVNHPVPGGMLETAENLRRDYAIPPARSRTDWPCAPTRRRSPPSGKAASRTRSCPSPYGPGRARPSSTPTNTPAPTRRWRNSPACARYSDGRIARRPSPL